VHPSRQQRGQKSGPEGTLATATEQESWKLPSEDLKPQKLGLRGLSDGSLQSAHGYAHAAQGMTLGVLIPLRMAQPQLKMA